jgi:uncharacterized protein YneF (UPF0154 family)
MRGFLPAGGLMMLLVVLGFLAGMLLGLRFAFLILLPAIMLAWILTICADIVRDLGFWWILLDMLVVSVALQLGYVAGALVAVFRRAMDSMFDIEPELAVEPLRDDEQGLGWRKAG